MRWNYQGKSDDLEDRRGGSFGSFPIGGTYRPGGLLLLLLLSFVFKRDFLSLVSTNPGGVSTEASRPLNDPAEEPRAIPGLCWTTRSTHGTSFCPLPELIIGTRSWCCSGT